MKTTPIYSQNELRPTYPYRPLPVEPENNHYDMFQDAAVEMHPTILAMQSLKIKPSTSLHPCQKCFDQKNKIIDKTDIRILCHGSRIARFNLSNLYITFPRFCICFQIEGIALKIFAVFDGVFVFWFFYLREKVLVIH